ncbi:dynactin subunit 1-like [Nannochloropsis oceanica]
MWAGIRLDEPSGNHDGEFKGERYFTCEPKHGLFQHLGNIKVIDNFEAPLAYSPKLHSTPLASASTASSVLGALAQSPNTRRADNLSSPRGAATVPQMLCPSTHSMSRRTITSPVDNTNTYTSTRRNSGSINSTNINDECIQSITLPDTARKPPAAETASIIATNRDELLDVTILEQILYSSAVHEKLAGMISEEVEKKVQERLQQVREDTTAQLTRETSFMSTFVNGAIVRIEDKITELKDSIIINAVAATGSREDQEQMERNKQALAAIMEIASATKQQLQEEVKQRAEAIQQLCIMSEEETEGP